MALPLVYHLTPSKLHHLPFRSSRARLPLLHRFVKISSLSHRRRHLPILQAMKPSADIDLNGEESSNKDSKSKDSTVELVPSPGSVRLPLPNIPVWARWVLGSLICLAVPFYKRIRTIQDGVEKTAETVVEVIEKVAEVTEEIASDVADALPEGSLKQTAMEIERIAEEVDKGAERVEEFLDKVDKIEDQVEDLVEPMIEEAERKQRGNQVVDETSSNTDLPKATSEPNKK
ncbi:hypothetical protein J5N97_009685 [Dioscorea zingiberensis]|uniref:Uncharacterized protein n=1 Tax=Dioscorea zingiberensis TaxID=325984 RepID=A0A9D5CZY1_9LILI|nr:hypothetical protein J5N97_009685 [Dioscorea zingiberensis]